MTKGIKQLWNVPCRTHNRILAILSNDLPLEMSLENASLSFQIRSSIIAQLLLCQLDLYTCVALGLLFI